MSWREAELYEAEAYELRHSQSLPTPEEFYSEMREAKELIGYMNQMSVIPLEERKKLLDPLRIVYLYLQKKIDIIHTYDNRADEERKSQLTEKDFGITINAR